MANYGMGSSKLHAFFSYIVPYGSRALMHNAAIAPLNEEESTMKHMKGVESPSEAPDTTPEKRRWLFDHPIVAMLAMILFFMVLSNGAILGIHYAGFDFDGDAKQIVDSIVIAVAAILTAIVFQFHFRKDFDGMFGWSTVGMLMVLPAFLFVIHNVFDVEKMAFVFTDPAKKMNSIPLCLIMGLAPGIAEEIVFRGIPCSNWMRVAKDESDVMKCVLFTAIIFGFVHGLNALAGAPIFATVFQVCYAVAFGIFLAAVFLRSGSIWPTMIVHTLIDFSAFLYMDVDKGGIITEELTIDLGFFITIGLSVFMILIALIMLRRSKREQILQLWDRKWHKANYINQGGYTY